MIKTRMISLLSSIVNVLVPGVFLELCERRKDESRRGEKKKNLRLTFDLNLTFMQTPAIRHVKLLITKGTSDNLAITRPLGYYQSNEPIILIFVFVKISTNPSLRVRS